MNRRDALQQSGFTLIELLVALFVSALMFAIGYGALTEASRHRLAVSESQASLGELQRALRVIADDVGQLQPRPIRDELGRTIAPALVAEPGTPSPIALTRGGRPPLSLHIRGSLQRVEYLLESASLVRIAWPVLDRTQATSASRRILIHQVRSVSFRYLGSDGEWRSDWPTDALGRARPRAVEIILDTERYGSVRRVVEVPR